MKYTYSSCLKPEGALMYELQCIEQFSVLANTKCHALTFPLPPFSETHVKSEAASKKILGSKPHLGCKKDSRTISCVLQTSHILIFY